MRRSGAARSRRPRDVSTVITAGAGVITWRACCSCRWKTPVSIPASFGSSLPPVSDSWISTRSSSGVSPSSSWPEVRTPSRRRIPFDAAFSARDERVEDPREEQQRARAPAGDGLRLLDRVDLRDLLAERDVERRRDQVRERDRDRRRDPVRHLLAEQVLEQRADRRLAEEAEAQRGERDADLRRREVAREVVHHRRPRSPRRACPRRRPSAGAPCANGPARTRRPRRTR